MTKWKTGDATQNLDEVKCINKTDRQSANKYIKTTADGEQPNNLLSLPECP